MGNICQCDQQPITTFEIQTLANKFTLMKYTYNLAEEVDQFSEEFFQNDYSFDMQVKEEVLKAETFQFNSTFLDIDLCFVEINEELAQQVSYSDGTPIHYGNSFSDIQQYAPITSRERQGSENPKGILKKPSNCCSTNNRKVKQVRFSAK